jgi:hypothetical protein
MQSVDFDRIATVEKQRHAEIDEQIRKLQAEQAVLHESITEQEHAAARLAAGEPSLAQKMGVLNDQDLEAQDPGVLRQFLARIQSAIAKKEGK